MFTKLASTDGSLSDLITNFNTTAGALAAGVDATSRASIQQLAPTLEEAQPSLRHLNNALPPFRGSRVASLPGIRQLPATIKAGSPWLVQTRKLLRQNELGGTAKLLASAAPPLAKATHATLSLFPQISLTSRCVIPQPRAGRATRSSTTRAAPTRSAPASPSPGSSSTASSNLAGESQGFDGNGPFVRFQAGGGPQLVSMPNSDGGPVLRQQARSGATTSPTPLGTRPRLPERRAQPPFRMDVPCYTQAVPDLNGPPARSAPRPEGGPP